MKENKYDNNTFFEKYKEMPRSKGGLMAAGEWPWLERMMPVFSGKRVLDLGCGFGWHCRYAIEHGASRVVGVDISEKMLTEAEAMPGTGVIEYVNAPIENVSYPDSSFDVVISSLAFHYIKDIDEIYARVYKMLSPGGDFVFSAEHPVFTAQGPQDWHYDESGRAQHWPVDSYFIEGKREALFLGEHVIKYHKTLTTYICGLLKAGFELKDLCEPGCQREGISLPEGMEEELRRPMMILIAAKKPLYSRKEKDNDI